MNHVCFATWKNHVNAIIRHIWHVQQLLLFFMPLRLASSWFVHLSKLLNFKKNVTEKTKNKIPTAGFEQNAKKWTRWDYSLVRQVKLKNSWMIIFYEPSKLYNIKSGSINEKILLVIIFKFFFFYFSRDSNLKFCYFRPFTKN